MYDHILDILSCAIEKYVPLETSSESIKKPHCLSKALKEKINLYRKSKNDLKYISAYKAKSKEYDRCVRKWYDDLEMSICKNPTNAKLYCFINKKIHARTSIPAVKSKDGFLVFLDDKKAILFNSVFQKVFIDNNGVDFHTDCLLPSHKRMQDIEITSADVTKALHRLNTSMSESPNNIPACFLKQVSFTLVHIMTYLFNLTLLYFSYQVSGNVPLLHLYTKRVLMISPQTTGLSHLL